MTNISGVSEFNQTVWKSPVCRSSVEQCKFLRCVGVQEKEASVAADEMAVKRQSADTNFLEKKIGC